MNRCLTVGLIILFGCGGTLTEEQRKKAKKDMADHALKKVSEAQITESAFLLGRTIAKFLERKSVSSSIVLDSLQSKYQSRITMLSTTSKFKSETETQLLDAYVNAPANTELTDNVQRAGKDSILYTKPITKTLPDGSKRFNYAIGVTMPKRIVVLSIKE